MGHPEACFAQKCKLVAISLQKYADKRTRDKGGHTMNRPAWSRLMEDVKARRVGTVIVKDMSRVGRNYLDRSEPPPVPQRAAYCRQRSQTEGFHTPPY